MIQTASRSLWSQIGGLLTLRRKSGSATRVGGEIGADAITADLRTRGNTLSFWICQTPETSELQEVVLAFAAGWKRPDKLDLVWIERELIESSGIRLDATKGNTRVVDLQNQHVDATHLDLWRLGKLAEHVAEAIRMKVQWRRFTKNEVVETLMSAVRSNRLDLVPRLRNPALEYGNIKF